MQDDATPTAAASDFEDARAAAEPDPGGPPALRLPFDMRAIGVEPVRTERMLLRPLAPTDADDVYEYQRLPEVLRYIPWVERDRTEGREHTEQRASSSRLADDGDAVFFAMVLTGEPSVADAARDRVIGDLMLRLGSAEHAQVEVGWVVHPDYQRRGLAAEGAAAVIAFAFEKLGAHRVFAHLDARNAASAALCERLGMRHEGTIVEEEYADGEWSDTAIYGVLLREWRAARAQDS
jgi:RimJ/RimL family protein N-acetyltransferase